MFHSSCGRLLNVLLIDGCRLICLLFGLLEAWPRPVTKYDKWALEGRCSWPGLDLTPSHLSSVPAPCACMFASCFSWFVYHCVLFLVLPLPCFFSYQLFSAHSYFFVSSFDLYNFASCSSLVPFNFTSRFPFVSYCFLIPLGSLTRVQFL